MQPQSRQNQRVAHHTIDPLFIARWSPRAFDAQPMPSEHLFSILEAARWAPSAYNIQPWRFVYAHREDAAWSSYLDLLEAGNATWAQHAAALVFLLSDQLMPDRDGKPATPSKTHAFDAGAAWAQLALQSTRLGYQAHAMGGIHAEAIRRKLHIPDRYQVQIAIAIGRPADPSALPEDLRLREMRSDRLALSELAFEGEFPRV